MTALRCDFCGCSNPLVATRGKYHRACGCCPPTPWGGRVIRNMGGDEIHSVPDWFRHAPPKQGISHWRDGRSAKELAKAFFRTGGAAVPAELAGLFGSDQATSSFDLMTGIAEATPPLDRFGGYTTHRDLELLGRVGQLRTLASLEAKADERFGDEKIGPYALAAPRGSNIPNRVDSMCRAVFGRPVVIGGTIIDAQLGQLRYQLLHAFAAALISAQISGAEQAVFVVLEFWSQNLNQRKVQANRLDFENFVRALPGQKGAAIKPGSLVGPISVPGYGSVPGNIPIWIGKATVMV